MYTEGQKQDEGEGERVYTEGNRIDEGEGERVYTEDKGQGEGESSDRFICSKILFVLNSRVPKFQNSKIMSVLSF